MLWEYGDEPKFTGGIAKDLAARAIEHRDEVLLVLAAFVAYLGFTLSAAS
jgi:hypothetical protein